MADHQTPSFSVNMYDQDGDIYEKGIYLHYDDTAVKIANDFDGFKKYIEHLQAMVHEIGENC